METTVTYDLSGALGIENLILLNTGINLDIDGTGTIANNKIVGNDGNNQIVGDNGNDTLTGGAGNDTLVGDIVGLGGGIDVMIGGAGDDVYELDRANLKTFDTIVEGVNGGHDTVRVFATATAYVLGANLEDIELMDGPITVVGNAGNNKITGSDDENTLNGGAGVDTLIGGGGDDIYVVDRIEEIAALIEDDLTGGTDQIFTPFSVTLSNTLANIENVGFLGSANADAVGNNSDNRFIGNAGRNRMEGLIGDDTLTGGVGADTMIGGKGDDRLQFDNLGDVLDEQAGEGNDTVESTLSVDLRLDRFKNIENVDIVGGAALFAIGTAARTHFWAISAITSSKALKGNDTILGFNGNDTIDGGDGADDMQGGANNDTFYGRRCTGDTVTDIRPRRQADIRRRRQRHQRSQLHAISQCREPDIDRRRRHDRQGQ